jgi:uncharacterized protein YciI
VLGFRRRRKAAKRGHGMRAAQAGAFACRMAGAKLDRTRGRNAMNDQPDLSPEELHAKMLKKQLWIVMSKAVKPPEEVMKQRKVHLQYQIKLERDGILYGAGPATPPGDSKPAFGLIVIRAKDEAGARKIADADPMHSSGARTYQLYEWSLNEGRINVSLNFSDQTFRFD